MQNQLGQNNTEQKMIGGKPGVAASRASSSRINDAFVANTSEKRYLWTARAFAIITAISICCNIVMLLAITQLLPLYRVEPFLLSFQNKQEQVYKVREIGRAHV